MNKKYQVSLSEKERKELRSLLQDSKLTTFKKRRIQILLKADVNGLNWTDQHIAKSLGCRIKTVENIRKRFASHGLGGAVNRKEPALPPRRRLISSSQRRKIIVLAATRPPRGYSNWSLRLLAEKAIELGIVDQLSYETLRKSLLESP